MLFDIFNTNSGRSFHTGFDNKLLHFPDQDIGLMVGVTCRQAMLTPTNT